MAIVTVRPWRMDPVTLAPTTTSEAFVPFDVTFSDYLSDIGQANVDLHPPPSSATCITESFDQPDSSTIGPDLTWVTPEPNNGAVTFDQAYSTESTIDSAFSYTAVGAIDVEVSATVVALDPAFAEYDLFARVTDAGDDWITARFQTQAGDPDLVDVFTGVPHGIIDQFELPEGTIALGSVLSFIVTGTTSDMNVIVKIDGVTVASANAAQIAAFAELTYEEFLTEFPFGENAGLGIETGSANANRLDNFQVCPAGIRQDGLDLIQILVDDVPAVVLVPKPAEFDIINIGEERDEATHLSGGLGLSILARALVFPTRGVEQRPKEGTRVIDWTSPQYDDSGWINATNILFASFAKSTWPAFVPWAADFPSDGIFGPFSGAQILWADNPFGNPSTYLLADPGHCYFRYQEASAFGVDGVYRFNLTSDDRAEAFLDGQQILTNQDFTQNSSINVEVTAGTRTLAIHGENVEYLGGGWAGPGGVALSIQYLTLISQDIVGFTTDDWKVYPYSDDPPGVTVGFAMRVLLEEMQARGVFTSLTWTFDDTLDSNGNAWDLMPGFSAQIGMSMQDWIIELAQTYCDVEMDPDLGDEGWVLHAWRKGEKGTASGVTFVKGVNVERLQARRENYSVNRLLLETDDDWFQVDSAGPQALYGIAEEMIALGAPFSQSEVLAIVDPQLAEFDVPREEITAESSLIAPYADGWRTGDTVLSPDSTGTTNEEFVLGISCSGTRDENVTFTVTLRNVLMDPEERIILSVVRGT